MSLRVFELAKELNVPTKELISRINNLDIPITGNFSSLTDEQITIIKKDFLEPTTRIKETVVPSVEGPKKVRKRIISAKKAKESLKIKKSLQKDEEAREEKKETKAGVAETKDKKAEEPKKIIRKKPAAKAEPVTETEAEETTAADVKTEKTEDAKEPKRRIKVIRKKPADQKAVAEEEAKAAEVKKDKADKAPAAAVETKAGVKREAAAKGKPETEKEVKKAAEDEATAAKLKEEEKGAAGEDKAAKRETKSELKAEPANEAKPAAKDKEKPAVRKEPKEKIAAKGSQKAVPQKPEKAKDADAGKKEKVTEPAEADKGKPDKKVAKTEKTEDGKKSKPIKIEKKDSDEELGRKAGKVGKKDKFKKKSYNEELDNLEDLDGTEVEEVDYSQQAKFKQKKRLSKAARKKERNRKQKEVKKEKHTFNPRQKDLIVGEFITVGELAGLIGIKVPEIIKTLMSLGIMATITQSIDGETAVLVAAEHGVEVKVEFDSIEDSIDRITDKESNLQSRPPVVTIMGHVDHGKTSLLDKIRSTNVIGDEAGGITQHIGAYHVKTDDGYICFLDTPGHEAFTAMRARGANVTDIVVLVVAADDGPRPQTVEAIDHAKAAEVEIIVAVNKCDKPDANPDRTIQQLMEYGLVPEEFGGNVPTIKVSAKTGDGISKLMEMIHLQAEIMELKADPDRLAQGVVIESKLDKGRGNTATMLIQTGTLHIGENYVVGTEYGRVRAMWNDRGKKIDEATPSVPVEIVGLNGLPKAGDRFNVGEDEKQVRQIAALRSEKEKSKRQAQQQKRKLEYLIDSMGKDEKRILNLILKTDVIGSLEAITDALNRLGNDQVAIRIIRGAVGAITNNDVLLAATSDAVVLGFNTRPDAMARKLAVEENIDIRLYSVIYEAIDDITKALEGMLEPIIREEIQGRAEVLEVFNIPKVGVVAGSKVVEGKFVRDCPVRVIRDNVIIHDGKLSSLKRFKDSAKEVLSGFECGIGIESYKDIRVGDELESYVRLETAAKL